MKAVLLAGGLGTRLRPVTYEIPKPLIPIQGKPLIEHIIELLKNGGVSEFYLAIGYKADQIKKHLGGGSRLNIKIHYIIEDEPLGTGGWMHLAKRIKGNFFVVNADNLFDIDIRQFMEQHKKTKAVVSIALTEVQDVSAYGMAELAGDKILRFIEKPKPEETPSHFASSGYYLFNEKAFDYIPEKKAFMLEKDLFPKLAEQGKLYSFKSCAQWCDTGTFETWNTTIHEWKKK